MSLWCWRLSILSMHVQGSPKSITKASKMTLWKKKVLFLSQACSQFGLWNPCCQQWRFVSLNELKVRYAIAFSYLLFNPKLSWQHWFYNFSDYKWSPNTIENWPSRRFWQNCKPQACCNSYNLWQKVHIFWKFRNVISLLSSSSFKFMTFLPLQLSILQTWHGGFVNLCWQLQPNSLTLNYLGSFITVKLFKLHICAHNYSDTLELLLKEATNFYFLNISMNHF